MTPVLPGNTRERRIEEPTNLWIVHPIGRHLLPWFVAQRISANAVSIGGLAIGLGAAAAYYNWRDWPMCLLGLALTIGWLIADGLDGMIARATGTASAVGRFLDGLCDHGVFVAIYVAMALSIGTAEAWVLACTAGALHALQSNIYEGERTRFHQRRDGRPADAVVPAGNALVWLYDAVGAGMDRTSRRFDDLLARSPAPRAVADRYVVAAIPSMRLMCLLSANTRVQIIFLACIAGDPRAFWWVEIVALTAILIIGFTRHRMVEARLVRAQAGSSMTFINEDFTRP
ncbi:MAG: CDP-alcohol phosphatidyltransferase family protein [Pseudomonadota bacterium]